MTATTSIATAATTFEQLKPTFAALEAAFGNAMDVAVASIADSQLLGLTDDEAAEFDEIVSDRLASIFVALHAAKQIIDKRNASRLQ